MKGNKKDQNSCFLGFPFLLSSLFSFVFGNGVKRADEGKHEKYMGEKTRLGLLRIEWEEQGLL